jgi:hypothetical protein
MKLAQTPAPVERSVVRQKRLRFVVLEGKLLLSILRYSMESRSFPFSFDIAGRYAKHRKAVLFTPLLAQKSE